RIPRSGAWHQQPGSESGVRRNLLFCDAKLKAQFTEPRALRAITDNFTTQSGMALLNRTESSQQQFVTLTGDKIADAEYDTGRQRIRFWIENIWINSVVNHWS